MKISNDFEKIAKKSKRRTLIKTVVLTSLVVMFSLGLGIKVLREVTNHNANRIKDSYLLMSEVAYPNISYQNWYFKPTSLFTGQFESSRSKNIDGIEIPYESMEGRYSLIYSDRVDMNDWTYLSSDRRSVYTQQNKYKVPIFYNINHQSTEHSAKVTQDVDSLAQMKNQAVEVAVTFDKPYTYEEIKERLPDNLLLNWLWIGTSSKFDTSYLSPQDQLGLAASDSGLLSNYDFTTFSRNLKKAVSQKYLDVNFGDDLVLKDDAKTFLKENKTFQTAKFSGIILTGKAENFAQLKGKTWIYATNIGQSVAILPYHRLTK